MMVVIRTRWQRRNGIQAWSCWWFLAQIFSWSTLIDSSYLSVKISRVGKKVEAGFLRQVPYWLTYVACYTSPTAMEAAQSSPKSIDLRILSSTETSIDWWQGPKIVKGSVRSGRRRTCFILKCWKGLWERKVHLNFDHWLLGMCVRWWRRQRWLKLCLEVDKTQNPTEVK